ncbi:MAG: glycerol-3-phosphate 1-O-acyltransferase PlsY [Alphaproteobacteria bacterium]
MPDPLGGFAYTWPLYAAGFVAYLLGSIPFGLVLTRIFKAGDLRAIGSGNIGATNVLRTGRKGLALATLLFDAAKGLIAVLAAAFFGTDMAVVAGVAAVIGHMFPVWLKFRGGKGVATVLGVLFAVSWPVAIATCLVWLAVALVSRLSSLAAIVAMIAAPILLWLMLYFQREGTLPYWLPGEPQHVEMIGVLAVLVLVRHHANIRRLISGTEPRIGDSAK